MAILHSGPFVFGNFLGEFSLQS